MWSRYKVRKVHQIPIVERMWQAIAQSGSRRYLASSPHTTLHAAPHRAVHLERLTCFLVRIVNRDPSISQ